ncbi:MAG: helix-turn-helix transcriptional regulator [Balneolales bacterium]
MEEYNNKKLREIASDEISPWVNNAKKRQGDRMWLKKSQRIALKVLMTLRERGLQQKELARQLGVSAQQVNKIVKGKENMTLETIDKLEQVLGVTLVEIPDEEDSKVT